MPQDLVQSSGPDRKLVSFPCGDVVLRGEQWAGLRPGREVLFLHGAGQTRHSWSKAAEEMACSGWTSTTVDLRGHGESDWSQDADYRLNAYASDVQSVVSRLGSRPVLVGASLGGLSALTAQASDPDLARALVLVDIVPRVSAAGFHRIRDFMTAHLHGFNSLQEAANAVSGYTGRKRRLNLAGLQRNVRLREDGRWYWHWDPRILPGEDMDSESTKLVEHLLSVARTVTIPVLIVRGEHSDVVTDEGVQELDHLLTNSSVVEVSGAGHMVTGQDNDVFTAAILEFIARLST